MFSWKHIYFDSMYVASTCKDRYDKVFYVERQVVYVGRQVVHVKGKMFAWKNQVLSGGCMQKRLGITKTKNKKKEQVFM